MRTSPRPGARRRRWALPLSTLLVASGCVRAACPVELHTDPARLLAQHSAARPALRALRAEATVDQRGRDGRIKGRVMMFVERPDHVRFDAMTQFGPALILTSDGAALALSDLKEHRYYTGSTCPRNIARVIGVALSGEEIVRVLLGEAPSSEGKKGSLTCAGGCYEIELERPGGLREQLTFSVRDEDRKKPPAAQRTRLTKVVLRDARGKALYRVHYDDYRHVGEVLFPFTVQIIDERNNADTLLRFSEIKLDPSIPEGAFAQSPRPGLTIEALDCE